MNTGKSCIVCGKGIITNQVIVGFPVIKIFDLNKSAMTGQEMLCHADCFMRKMHHTEPVGILQLNGKQ